LRVALGVLDKLAKDRVSTAIPARKLRAIVFYEAAQRGKRSALERAANQFGLDPDALLAGLFADLPEERTLSPLASVLDTTQLALLCNASIVRRLLESALQVKVVVRGQVRAVVRHAKWTGLLCTVRSGSSEEHAMLEISGPYALFRHTRLYGRALASLVPRLARCNAYRLEADCVLGDGRELARLKLRSGDPICPARELPQFDSSVEERFAKEFSRLAHDWDLVREPRPIALGRSLFFPDFQLRRRTTGECYWLEIIGYWTPEYLTKKLAQLEQAQLERIVLCVDESRQCSTGQFNALGSVVRYRRRIDVRAVIAIIDPALSSALAAQAKATPRRVRSRVLDAAARGKGDG
jgi:predicted nuclease of restriction endonuclease-like RecB superfamily